MDINNAFFDLNKFKIFYFVAKYNSFSKAAKILHTTQPNISYAIKILEEQLDLKLFIRENKNITLTEDGKNFFLYIENSFSFLINGYMTFKNKGNEKEIEIRIGVMSHIGSYLLDDIIANFSKKHSNVKFTIFSASSLEMKEKFENKDLDILIMNHPVYYDKLKYNEKKLMVLDTIFFGTKTTLSKFLKEGSDIKKTDLILPMKGFITSSIIEKELRYAEGIIIPKHYVYSSEMLISLVKKNMGIGLVIKKLVEKDIENGLLYEIPTVIKPPVLEYSIVYNSSYQIEIIKEFINYVTKNI